MVHDLPSLISALADAPAGAVVRIGAVHLRVDREITLDRPVTLQGPEDRWALLEFTTPASVLRVMADDCSLRGLTLTGIGQRAEALLDLRGAARARVADCLMRASSSPGLRASGCKNLVVSGLTVTDMEREAVVLNSCSSVKIAVRCRRIGTGRRAPAIHLLDCTDVGMDADMRHVSGSAVTVEVTNEGLQRMALHIRGAHCYRALTVLGRRELPLEGLSAVVRADAYSDTAALLSNVRGAMLSVQAGEGEGPALRLNGGFGVHGAMLVVETAGDARQAVEVRGANSDNLVLVQAPAAPDSEAAAAAHLDPALWNLTRTAAAEFESYEIEDTCSVCGWQGRFRRSLHSERETLACGRCRASLRYRGQAEALLGLLAPGRRTNLAAFSAEGGLAGLRIYEPGLTGPLRPFLARAAEYRISFYEPGLPSGTVRDGVECQDLMGTSFPDESFDLVVTSDIFEHVRRPFAAFAEIRRILKPGGAHVFTVPMARDDETPTVSRVDTSGADDEFPLPPVYHASGGEGLSLVYTDFGTDILSHLAAIGLPTRLLRHRPGDRTPAASITLVSRRPS